VNVAAVKSAVMACVSLLMSSVWVSGIALRSLSALTAIAADLKWGTRVGGIRIAEH
jgi:hypothetical protein